MGTTRLLYARALIHQMGWDRTVAREMCLVAQMTAEGAHAHWNPMDTTMPSTGATPYNSFGANGELHVWNYATASAGVEATLATLRQENMRPWTEVIARPRQPVEEMARAFGNCPWGGIGDMVPLEIVQAWVSKTRNYKSDANAWVDGPGSWPFRRSCKPL